MLALNGPYCIHIGAANTETRAAWSKPQRRLTWYLLVCSTQGEEQIRVDGADFVIPERGAYLIPPGALSDIGSRAGNRPAWIHFHVRWDDRRDRHPQAISYADDWAERSVLKQPSPREVWGVDLPVRVPEGLAGLFADGIPRIVDQWRKHTSVDIMAAQHRLAGLLLAWVTAAARDKDGPSQTDVGHRLLRAEMVARESLGQVFGVSEFAAAAGLSRSRFSVLYRRHTGQTPARFLRETRLRQAEALLLGSGLTVAEIGRIVGYRDPSVFGRVFRRAKGCTPAVWLRRQSRVKAAPSG